ncbi:arylsulfatase A-like enzyme [Actinoplanes lutulentus]|uniref:Arylsulfatase A-like enzyme n=1 Tax=Actinoplanes lutulentus TaxID=1287878 RepID=A0A327ZFM2_9ACTN|nr:sulfatase [Actinoplanes lutulentus]MBB2947979.1 arylsulfatase A-like enzyme [Actinoplanes lutulentus]RAK40140.1 arylsulfatase A-like enzyme [Actinoplanes lutulentus]
MSSRSRRALSVAAVAATLLAATACTTTAASPTTASPAPSASRPSPAEIESAATQPNIVLVLTDDLSKNLVRYMPNLRKMQQDGTTFTNYTVTDSLCCPSRASLFKGQFPHNTGIYKNHGSDGGFRLFHSRGQESSTFATDLKAAGYRTGFFGKYLNEYLPATSFNGGKPYVPPGWDQWFAGGNAYDNFNYALNENGTVKKYGKKPADYLTDVLSAKATGFITSSAATGSPFMLEVSTYAPHAPYTPAPRDAKLFPGLTAPRTAAYDRLPEDAPAWLATHPRLNAAQKSRMDAEFRKRAQSVQSVDRMLGALRDTLTTAGVADDTLVVFASDNGYHMGEYTLPSGKQTAFDTDVNVPLIVTGHGVKAGQTVEAVVENTDLRPTFADLAGERAPAEVDGQSLRQLLAGETPALWRKAALIEHRDPATDPADPDYEHDSINIPPAYDAIRTADFTYVQYVDGTREYYDRRADPDQLRNLAGSLPADRLTQLRASVRTMTKCVGAEACLRAASAIS